MLFSTQSASVGHLLSHFDRIENVEAFLTNAVEEHKTTRGSVNLQLWTAFSDYASAEDDYSLALKSMTDRVARELNALDKGNTADSSWIAQGAKTCTEATHKMETAVKTIMTLRAIYNTL